MKKERLLEKIIRFIRYFFVGVIAALVDYAFSNMMYLLLNQIVIGDQELLIQNVSGISGILVGLIVNYFLALRLVFKADKSLKDFLKICLITGVSMLLTFGLTTLNVIALHLPFVFFKIITMGIAFIWNYFARSFFVYNSKGIKEVTQ